MIRKIRIQNFKSLRDVTVDLDPVTVFVGTSGVGKTNLVTALAFFRDYISSESHGATPNQHSNYFCATNPDGTISFDVEFDVPGFSNDRFRYSLALTSGAGFGTRQLGGPKSEQLQFGKRILFSQTQKPKAQHVSDLQWTVEPALVPLPPPGQLAIGRLAAIEEVTVALTALTTGVGVYSFPFDVLAKPSQTNGDSGLSDDAGNYLTVIKEIATNLRDIHLRKEITAALRRINSTVGSVDLDSISEPSKVVVSHRFGEKTLPLDLPQESTGFRRFYAHLLALYQTPSKQTLVFEEPENGIHPGALSLLADEFKIAPAAGRGQVILTTQSPSLLDHFSAEPIRVVELEQLETKVGPLVAEQREAITERLLHTGELLTTDLARREEVAT